MDYCCWCGGVLCFLGQLGNLIHFRCRNCGMTCSHPDENNND